jgi:uncharacterized damage-inducible protein DinB
MMIVELIRNLYQYNNWANTRILNTAAQLRPDQLRAETKSSFGSVHSTLVHIVEAQWTWLKRWHGHSPSAPLDPQSFKDLIDLRTHWEEIESETQNFVATCTESDLARLITYRNYQNELWTYPLWQQMLHQVNHATQHRSEVALVLSAWGFSPGWMDFLYFIDENRPS